MVGLFLCTNFVYKNYKLLINKAINDNVLNNDKYLFVDIVQFRYIFYQLNFVKLDEIIFLKLILIVLY